MKYTNKHNLPDAFMRCIINDKYSKGDSDFSATGLLNPPRATVLLEIHKDEIEIDVSSRVAATIGQGVHSILERAQRLEIDTIEQRSFGKFEVSGLDYTVSAQIDLYESDTKTLYDWKTTKSFAFHKKASAKPEWAAQLNIGRTLFGPEKIEHLKIIGLLKDWDYKKAKTEPGYPETEVMSREIPIWPVVKTSEFIKNRISLIVQARKELPRCSSTETWGGSKCKRYCDAATFCTQYQESKKTGVLNEVSEIRESF